MEPSVLAVVAVGPLVRITTGIVVSSVSMVSRAFLKDQWLGVVVEADDSSLWLASSTNAFVPDMEVLAVRGAAAGGPPVEYGKPMLQRIVVGWGGIAEGSLPGGEVTITNPQVHVHPGGAAVAVVPISKNRDVKRAVADNEFCQPVRQHSIVRSTPPDELQIMTVVEGPEGSVWPIARIARVASDRDEGFLGEPGAVALDVGLEVEDAGAPAFLPSQDGPLFHGLVRPLGGSLAVLSSFEAIIETIAHAQSL